MSGFFFCGSIDEPVAYASSRRAKPNSSVVHSTNSSPMRDRSMATIVEREQRLGDVVARADRVERVLEPCREPEPAGREVGIERQRRAGQRAGAERRDVDALHRVEDPLDVAPERPAVRQQVMGEQHRLGALHVRVARQVDVAGGAARSSRTACRSTIRWAITISSRFIHSRTPVADLIVATATGVQLRAGRAGELGDPPLDRGVDVFVALDEDEGSRRSSRSATWSSAAMHRRCLDLGDDLRREPGRARERPSRRCRRATAADRTTSSR